MTSNNTINHCTLFIILMILYPTTVLSYEIDPPNETIHQHISKEAIKLWPILPYEIKKHAEAPVGSSLAQSFTPDHQIYTPSKDIIIGSGDQDKIFSSVYKGNANHFWWPDSPLYFSGEYDVALVVYPVKFLGVKIGGNPSGGGSSYRKALEIWDEKVVKNYIAGNINESYYWLGRVTHLLEDASQPSHIHLDAHPPHIFGVTLPGGDSVLEEYTGNNFPTLKSTYNWTGSNFAGQQYNYENLPNMQNFNWAEVEPTDPTSRKNIELFRLFWYTAQKTQYFASDDVDGNSVYYTTNNVQKSFPTDLWSGENVKFVTKASHLAQDDINDSGPNVSAEANAMIPHAMKAVVADIDGNEVMELRNISEGDVL